MINLILYIPQASLEKGKSLKRIIDQNFYGVENQSIHTFNSFKSRLKNSEAFPDNDIFILFAESRKRLYELMPLIDLLENKRTILILPDSSKETLACAAHFFPRFFTTVSDSYNDLCDVLNTIIHQKNMRKTD